MKPAEVENTTEDDQAAPYRRLDFEFEASDAGLVLRSPRSTLRRDTALLSGCTVTVPWEALSMYATVASCEDDDAQPLSWGECEAPLTGFADDVRASPPPAPGPLDRVLSRGGKVYALEHGPQDAQCLPWVFTPGRKKSAYGRMVRTVTEGSRRTQTEYSYNYNGATILVLGPSTTVTENGREVSSSAFGCGERLYLRSPSPAYATAAGTPWFFSLEACRDAIIPPPPRGGC